MASPIPGATVLATYSAEPDWRQQKAVGLAQALGGAMDSYRARKAQEEAREQEEIQRFYEMAMRNSEIAATQGDWFKKKYGARYPQVNSLVDFLAKGETERRAEAERIRGAKQGFFSAQQAIEDRFRREHEAVAAMPDEVPVEVPVPSLMGAGGPGGFLTLPMPNAEKAVRSTQLSQVPPWMSSALAFQALTPEQRAYVRALKLAGSEFEPFGDDVPLEQRPLYQGAIEGRIPIGDITTAGRAGAGLQQKPAEVEGQKYKTSEREAEHAETLEVEREKNKLISGREEARDARAMARVKERGSIQSRLAAQRGAGKKGGAPLWRAATDASNEIVGRWQDGLLDAMKGIPAAPRRKDEKPEDVRLMRLQAQTGYLTENGGRPARLSATNAQRIQRKVNSMGLAPDDEELETTKLVEEFSRLTASNVTVEKAMEAVLGRESTALPANIKALVGDNEQAAAKATELHDGGKSWTEIEKLIRQAGAG